MAGRPPVQLAGLCSEEMVDWVEYVFGLLWMIAEMVEIKTTDLSRNGTDWGSEEGWRRQGSCKKN